MILGTGGSRIIRRNTTEDNKETLLEVSCSATGKGEVQHGSENVSCGLAPGLKTLQPKGKTDVSPVQQQDSASKGKSAKRSSYNAGEKTFSEPKLNPPVTSLKSQWINLVSKDDISLITKTQRQTYVTLLLTVDTTHPTAVK